LQAALFTAIVTAFALDALSSLNEDTSTQLLRILVKQATAGQDIDIPQPSIPSFIVTVSSLWLLSIMSSLAATTWAILSLEWFAFLTGGVDAEDHEEMAEKRQRRFEAIKRWKVHIVVASIPFFLHISLFLFLAGLWLRLRGVNRQLELVVGIPSLVIGLSYVILTLLPMFTEAPFFTSVSEMITPLVREFRYLLRLRRFLHAPPIFTWMSRSLASISSKFFPKSAYRKCLHLLRRIAATLLIYSVGWIYRFIGPLAYSTSAAVTMVLRATLPVFLPGGDPFNELNRFQIGPSDLDRGVHQRALLWLMNTPLDQSEVKEVLKELANLRNLENTEKPLDRAVVKLLVSSLSSVLENGRITEDERPVFDHCTILLTAEMSRIFRANNYDPRILVRNTVISNGLKGHVYFDTSAQPSRTQRDAYDEYWNKVVRLLWLSPSEEQIQDITERLESSVRSMRPSLLQRVVCGLHAATLTSLEANKHQSILQFPLPDFSQWHLSEDRLTTDHKRNIDDKLAIDNKPADDDWSTEKRLYLDRELSAFLQNLLVKFHEAAQPVGQKHQSPTTIPSFIVACIKLLDRYPQRDVSLRFHNTLRLFITTTWRNDPDVFDLVPSVAQALVVSINDFVTDSTQDTPDWSKRIAIRLHTIANGPKYLTSRQYIPSETIANLYRDSVKNNPECLSGFIHATAAVLEAVLSGESRPGVRDLQYDVSRRVVRSTVAPSYFTDRHAFDLSNGRPDHRLPYLYSLAIALSREIKGTGRDPLEVLDFLRPSGEKQANADIERNLDTGILVVNVLGRALSRQPEPAELRTHLDAITQALEPLRRIIEDRGAHSWRTRWKAIYLLADLRNVLPQALTDFAGLESLINGTSDAVRTYISEQLPDEPAPCDWKMKRDGLALCGLEEVVRELARRSEADEGVYTWCEPGSIPYLSLYPQRVRYDTTSQAPYRLLEKLQR